MAYYEDYMPDALRANIVPKEGIYLCKVSDVITGTMDDGKRYTQVKCVINCEGNPVVSIFLTEGNNFNGNLTAFYDTFQIPRNEYNFDAWKDKRGYLRINLVKKGEYTNMVPRYILDENGFVVRPTPNKAAHAQRPQQPQPYTGYEQMETSQDEFGDISF